MISVVNELENDLQIDEFESEINRVVKAVLSDEGFTHQAELSILIVDNEKIKEINEEARGIDEVTDVLSFPMIEFDEGKTYKDLYLNYDFGPEYFDGEALVLGDIVLSLERAKEQAIEYGHSLKREVGYLLTHSVFHLLGYDHMTKEDKDKMRVAEERVLETLAITRS